MRPTLILILLLALLTLHCNNTNEVFDLQQPRVTLQVTNLQPLGPGEGHYQVWATFLSFNRSSNEDSPQHDQGFLSLGEFNLKSGDPVLYDLSGTPARFMIPIGQNAQLLDDVIISIQTGNGASSDSLPGSIIMGGRFHGNMEEAVAELDVSYTDAFGNDFSRATGKFTITAPTSPADSNSGVWFIEQLGPTPSAGLRNLPVLPEGWVYEGWMGIPTVQVEPGKMMDFFRYFSTGRFVRADSADMDGAGLGSGPGSGFDFPGQDFITAYAGGPPPRGDLRSRAFMVSVEPEPDNSASPFILEVLSTPSPRTLLPQGEAISMNNVAIESFARAKITVVRSGY